MVNLEERFMIREMHRKGLSISEIARQTGRDRKTVRKIIRTEQWAVGNNPARRRRKKGQKLAPFEGYLKQRLGEGVLNTRKLLRELKARGYQGGLTNSSYMCSRTGPRARSEQSCATRRRQDSKRRWTGVVSGTAVWKVANNGCTRS